MNKLKNVDVSFAEIVKVVSRHILDKPGEFYMWSLRVTLSAKTYNNLHPDPLLLRKTYVIHYVIQDERFEINYGTMNSGIIRTDSIPKIIFEQFKTTCESVNEMKIAEAFCMMLDMAQQEIFQEFITNYELTDKQGFNALRQGDLVHSEGAIEWLKEVDVCHFKNSPYRSCLS